MARLIDADALNKELQKRVGSPTDDKLYEVNLCIINAPTINAIPVKWLEDRIYDMKRAPLYRRYTEMLLIEWLQEQKEQEAVYPTWYEWLTSIGAVTRKVKPDVASTLIETGLLDPIPADIAEKLGVEPK